MKHTSILGQTDVATLRTNDGAMKHEDLECRIANLAVEVVRLRRQKKSLRCTDPTEVGDDWPPTLQFCSRDVDLDPSEYCDDCKSRLYVREKLLAAQQRLWIAARALERKTR